MPSDEYIVARRVLLNALEALLEHREAIVLVGAQAIYLHTGDADLAVAESTTDGDLLLNPEVLQREPEIAEAMRRAGFQLKISDDGSPLVGIWASLHEVGSVPATVTVDLLVPKVLGGAGTRAARIPPHEKGAALKIHGLEAALSDNELHEIRALEASDKRAIKIKVAGPAALLVSKCIKLGERIEAAGSGRGRADRIKPKDALDVLRILRACEPVVLAKTLSELRNDPVAGPVTEETMLLLPELFGSAGSICSKLAAEAAYPEPPDVITASCAALTNELIKSLSE